MAAGIHIQHASKTFGQKHALDDLSFSVPEGHIFGFLGPNGAGKTTVIRCLMDYMHLSSGTMSILGKDTHKNSSELKNIVGYLPSDLQLHTNWNALTHIDFMASIKGRGQANELVKKLGLDLKPKVHQLSSGNKQKLAVVLAFIGSPKILIMDEPTRGLDPLLQNQLYELLHEFAAGGGTIFLSSHNLGEVQQLCSSIAVIKDGKLVAAQTMQDILQIKVHSVHAKTSKPINITPIKKLKNVEIVSFSPATITLKVRGPIGPVMTELNKYQLIDLEVTHLSLEDVFMEYY